MSREFKTEKEKALGKLQKYCAYQDRCHQEVRTKLIAIKIYGDDLEDIIATLIEDNFLNEERFARSYARGKFRMKQWGRVRIQQELKKRHISTYCIKKAMQEIEEEAYIDTLVSVLKKKQRNIKAPTTFILKGKLAKYAIGKGFESSLVWEMVNMLIEK